MTRICTSLALAFALCGCTDIGDPALATPEEDVPSGPLTFERDIKPKWSLAVFADSGNAFDERGLDMRTGAGIGARWRSPVGPVRIDVAWPVDDVEQGARLHISLGPDL